MNTVPQAADQVLPAIGALMVVLGLILALAWIARRWLRTPGLSRSGFTVLGALRIGPREKLLLVEIGGQQVLLGVTPGSVTSLQTLAQPIDLTAPSATDTDSERGSGPAPASSFAAVLARAGSELRARRSNG